MAPFIKFLKAVFLIVFLLACFVFDLHAESNIRITPVVKVVREKASSVVNISTEKVVLLQYNPYWGHYGGRFDDFFDGYARSTVGAMKLKGVGSGAIVSKDGLIVTNAHVINMTSKIFVILNDGTQYEAEAIAVDQQDDLALVKIHARQELKPIDLADDVIIGETVVAIGNPFGLENSVSAGIVSGTHRQFITGSNNRIAYNDLVQTDTSINPGNSGGALLNLEGKLVGINLAVIQNAQNVGFAIPAERIKELLSKYQDFLKKQTAVLKVLAQ